MRVEEFIEIIKSDIETFHRLAIKKQINNELSLDLTEDEWQDKWDNGFNNYWDKLINP